MECPGPTICKGIQYSFRVLAAPAEASWLVSLKWVRARSLTSGLHAADKVIVGAKVRWTDYRRKWLQLCDLRIGWTIFVDRFVPVGNDASTLLHGKPSRPAFCRRRFATDPNSGEQAKPPRSKQFTNSKSKGARQSMNSNSTPAEEPLHILIRRRRQELHLPQAEIAEALHVTPECVLRWECGQRRMELSKLPPSPPPCGSMPRNFVPKHWPSSIRRFITHCSARRQPGA